MVRNIVPVIEGEEYTEKIQHIGVKGDGIVRIKNYVIFIPNCKEGDIVNFKIIRTLPNYGFGEVISIQDKKESKKYEEDKDKEEDIEEEKTE